LEFFLTCLFDRSTSPEVTSAFEGLFAMAIYTTFFLANPSELLAGFPGWKSPLPAPVLRQFRNPFTKQLVSTLTRKPEWPNEENRTVTPQFRAATIQGRYEDHLEARLPQFVRANAHWAAKGLLEIELESLLIAIGASPKRESPLYRREAK
jgi:hypothetical protein